MKALFELFRRFDARRIFGFIRRLLGMSRPKVKCYDLLSNHALRVEGDRYPEQYDARFEISIHALRVEGDTKTDKIFVCFCEKGRRICLFKTRKEKNLPVAF